MIKRGQMSNCQNNPDCLPSHTGSGGEAITTVMAKNVLQYGSVGTPLSDVSWFRVHVPQKYFRGSLERCDNKLLRMCKVHFKQEKVFSTRTGERHSMYFQFVTIASSVVHLI